MNDSSTGPLIVGMLFIVRCLIPVGILFGFSYLLQYFGLVETYGSAKGSDVTPRAKKRIQSDKAPPKKKSRISTSKRKQTTKRKSVSKSKRRGGK